MLGHVGSHLEGRVHGNVECELIGNRSFLVLGATGHEATDVHTEHAGSEVHGATLEAGERQNGDVLRAHVAVLGAHGALVAHEVGIGAGKTGGTHCLVAVNHDVVLGSLLHGIEVMVHHALAVVRLALGQNVAHIATLHGIVAVLIHEGVGGVHVCLIVGRRAAGLVVHHQFYALAVGIVVECLEVEVGVRCDEVEDIFLLLAEPVFPAYVPALDEQLVEAVVGSEVYVAAHIGIVGAVMSVRLCLAVVESGKVEILGVGVAPLALAGNHLPPYTHVLRGMNPACIVQRVGLIEVINQVGSQDVGGRTNHNGTPGSGERQFNDSLGLGYAGGEPRGKGHGGVVEVEVHCGIIHEGGLMYVDVHSGIIAHEHGCLHAGGREACGRDVARLVAAVTTADFTQRSDVVLIFLRVVVARNPPCRMVARHGELRQLLGNEQ